LLAAQEGEAGLNVQAVVEPFGTPLERAGPGDDVEGRRRDGFEQD